MKLFLEEYGHAVIAVLTITLLSAICIIVRGYVLSDDSAIESMMIKDAGIYDDDSDRSVYGANMGRQSPRIYYCLNHIQANEVIDWKRIFHAEDADGSELEFTIRSIDGNADIVECFPRAGVYSIEVSACDKDGKRSTRVFLVPVLQPVKQAYGRSA